MTSAPDTPGRKHPAPEPASQRTADTPATRAEANERKRRLDERQDQALEESFPASDPPSPFMPPGKSR